MNTGMLAIVATTAAVIATNAKVFQLRRATSAYRPKVISPAML